MVDVDVAPLEIATTTRHGDLVRADVSAGAVGTTGTSSRCWGPWNTATLFLASPASDSVPGQTLIVDGGRST